MVDQAVASIVVGLGISAVLFVPLLVVQYRRFGRPSASRMIGYVGAAVYFAAIVAYTLFPLPDMSGGFCAGRHREFIVDPLEYFRDMRREVAGLSWAAVATSWSVMQMALNIALFVPLGVLLRQLWGMRAGPSIATGAAVSLFIECTQYTGNWFSMPCPYRVSDINDLLTNTLGTAVGVGIAGLLPRIFASSDVLAGTRLQPRPVRTPRRWLAMILDVGVHGFCGLVTYLALMIVGSVLQSRSLTVLSVPDSAWMAVTQLATLAVLAAVIVGPALVGSGASMGQRMVYLRPTPAPKGLLVVRALVVSGAFWLMPQVNMSHLLWTLPLVFVNVVIAAFGDHRGLSGYLSGTRIVDARCVPSTDVGRHWPHPASVRR